MRAKRTAFALLALVASVAHAQAVKPRYGPTSVAAAPAFQASQFGSTPASADLYTPFSSEFVGAWWYLRGDGTNQPGAPVTLSPVGTPVTQTLAVNGQPNGFTVQATELTLSAYKSAPVPAPAGSFSTGWLGTSDVANAGSLISKNDVGAGNAGFHHYNGGNSVDIAKSDVSGTPVGAGVSVARALSFYVMTYRFVTDGTSEIILYKDGVQFTSSTAVVGPMQNNSAVPWGVNYIAYASGGNRTNVAAAFMTEKALSAETIYRMAETVKPALRLANGQRYTFARASTATFGDSSGNRVGWVGSGVPRTMSGAYYQEPAATNLVTDSEDLTSGGWNNIGTIVRTANFEFAPDGSHTASRLNSPAVGVGGDQRIFSNSAITVSNTTQYTVSFWARATTGSATVPFFMQNQTLGGTAEQYTTTPVTTTWQRITKTFTTTGTSYLICIGNTHSLTGQTSAAWDAEVWGVELKLGEAANSYIRSSGGAATRAVDDLRWNWQRTNLIRNSQDFSAGTWTTINATVAQNTGDTLAPDGTSTAAKLTASGAGNIQHTVFTSTNNASVSGRRYAYSVYAKQGTGRYLHIARVGSHQAVTVDLQTGATTSTTDVNAGLASRFAPRDVRATPLTNGWYRVSFVGAAESTNDALSLSISTTGVTPSAPNVPTFAQAGEAVYLWGGSVSGWSGVDTDYLDGPYIPTTATAVTVDSINVASLNASGSASVGAFTFATPSNGTVLLSSGAGSTGSVLYRSTTALGSSAPGVTTSATSAVSVFNRWLTGLTRWSSAANTAATALDGAFGSNAAYTTPGFVTQVRIGAAIDGTGPANALINNVTLRTP